MYLQFEDSFVRTSSRPVEFEYKSEEERKRKRSISVMDSENDEFIDKAFKSRLMNKLSFGGCSDLDLFGDSGSDSWSCYKDKLASNLSDECVLQYLEEIAGKTTLEAFGKVESWLNCS